MYVCVRKYVYVRMYVRVFMYVYNYSSLLCVYVCI